MNFSKVCSIVIISLLIVLISCTKSKGPTESTVTGPPVIESITPSSGSELGGTIITISGSNFHPEASVKFGNILVTNLERESAYKISAMTPPHSIGTVDVVVSNPGDESSRLIDGFKFFFALFGQ